MGFRSLDDIVRDYIHCFRDRQGREHRWFAIQRSLEDAITNAAMAISPSGKRLHHQRRIPKAVLHAWKEALLKRRTRIRGANTFSELYDLLYGAAADLHGIGTLTVYDTARRIDAFLRLEPEHIYLHAGTREGAKALGFNSQDRLHPSELPPAFSILSAGESEDCLCIYKNEIRAVAHGAPAMPRQHGGRADRSGC
jgi:hypothetical protein